MMAVEKGERPLSPVGFAAIYSVSRETLAQLDRYLELLGNWQRAINLVGSTTFADPWRRHVLDSAQLMRFLPENARVLVDMGSGGGLPGLVLGILGVPDVNLVESDKRKSVFLREAARTLNLRNVTVHAHRIDAAPPIKADVITARALAPVPRLMEFAERFMTPSTRCLYLKGKQVEAELTEAREDWMMTAKLVPSLSSDEGRILILDEVQRAGEANGR
jgi:16S rRNA (guanine527-N7)-methyltransferase